MALHSVLLDKLNAALTTRSSISFTRRDAKLPQVSGKVFSVIGMRRSGKTTFLRQLVADHHSRIPVERAIYFGFDDDRLAGIDVEQLSFLLEEYFRVVPSLRGKQTCYWFLDEIQLVSGWERFVRRVLDTEKIEIVVSGSSARMLSREIHTSLRGRGIATVIRPFSFREVLRHRGEEPSRPPRRWTASERSLIEKRFREYLIEGGFPEVLGLTPALRTELLQGYVDTVLFRDVVERHQVAQVGALRWLVRHCLRTPTGMFSAHRLSNDLRSHGHGIARDLVQTLLGHLTDAFLLSEVALGTDSERKRNSNPRKIYPADPGLIRAFDTSGRAQLGLALETAVLNELERRNATVGYLRTVDGHEVDFLARYVDRDPELIQVCADAHDPATLERELRALRSLLPEHPSANALLLMLDRDSIPKSLPRGVIALPAYEWLLDPEATSR